MALTTLPLSGVAQTEAPATSQSATDQTATDQTASDPAGDVFTSPLVTLDRERMYQESAMGKAMQARFEDASNNLVAENRRLESALEEEERNLTQRRKTLDPEAFGVLSREFDTRVEELRKAQDAKSRALSRTRDIDQQQFFEATVPVLARLMVEIDAVAIIDRTAIILSFDQIDITEMAIARLDETLGDGSELPSPDEVPLIPEQP